MQPSKNTFYCFQCESVLKQNEVFYSEGALQFCHSDCMVEYFSPLCSALQDQVEQAKVHIQTCAVTLKQLNAIDPRSQEYWTKTLIEPAAVYHLPQWHQQLYAFVKTFDLDQQQTWAVYYFLVQADVPYFLCNGFLTGDDRLVDYLIKGSPVSKKQLMRMMEAQASLDSLKIIHGKTSPDREELLTNRQKNRNDKGKPNERNDPLQSFMMDDFFTQTLEQPDEVWTLLATRDDCAPSANKLNQFCVHNLIRKVSDEPSWYVIVAQDTEDDSEIEVLEAFLTNDPFFVQNYQIGRKFTAQHKEGNNRLHSSGATKGRKKIGSSCSEGDVNSNADASHNAKLRIIH